MRKEWHKVFFEEKFFLAQIFLQLALLPPLVHKEAMRTLEYPIALKLED